MTNTGSSPTRRRVLLIEDEYFIAADIARAFAESGAEVVGPVANLASALLLLEGSEPLDAAVLDINLRGEMVYPVADVLRARGVPFVFATGYDAISIPPRFADILRCEKPVAPNQVARALLGAN